MSIETTIRCDICREIINHTLPDWYVVAKDSKRYILAPATVTTEDVKEHLCSEKCAVASFANLARFGYRFNADAANAKLEQQLLASRFFQFLVILDNVPKTKPQTQRKETT